MWNKANEVQTFFSNEGLSDEQIKPVNANAHNLKFKEEFFDAVISIDSYQYFGCDADFLDVKLLPFVKRGGYVYIAVPGVKEDFVGTFPKELRLSWTPEQFDTIRSINYWKDIVSRSKLAEVVSVYEMKSLDECWNDWVACDNEYAKNDKKAIEAGATKYLNFIAMVLKKL